MQEMIAMLDGLNCTEGDAVPLLRRGRYATQIAGLGASSVTVETVGSDAPAVAPAAVDATADAAPAAVPSKLQVFWDDNKDKIGIASVLGLGVYLFFIRKDRMDRVSGNRYLRDLSKAKKRRSKRTMSGSYRIREG